MGLAVLPVTIVVVVIVCMLSGNNGELALPCPPPFINMEAHFAGSLQFNNKMRNMFHNFKLENSLIDNCKYSWDNLGNVDLFNEQRCSRNEDLHITCTTTTQSTTTTRPTTKTTASTSSKATVPSLPADRSTNQWSTGPYSRDSTSIQPQPVPQPSTPDDDDDEYMPTGPEADHTTRPVAVSIPPKNGNIPVNDAVAYNPLENRTTIYICIGAGVLLLVVMIAIGLICRSHSGVSDGVHKRNLQRQRSDLQPITSIQDDMSRTPSIASVGSWRYSRDMVRGKVWRPDYSASEESSERGSLRSSKFLLLREESQHSIISDFHFNTLNAIDHPNAMVLGSFGETSTDDTLKHKSTMKSNGTLPSVVSDTVKSKAEQTEITFTNEIQRQDSGFENMALIKSDSYDSIDRAIDDWKATIGPVIADEDLLNSQNESLFVYDNKALQRSEPDLTKAGRSIETVTPAEKAKTLEPNVAIVHPNQRLSVLSMKSFFENGGIASNGDVKKMPNGVVKLPNRVNSNNFENNVIKMNGKPSAHVSPQVCVTPARDADVQL